jgi:uncharacterized protein (TIGR03083 family)
MPDTPQTWPLIHAERAAFADTLATLTPQQWATPALCAGWSVQEMAAHIVAGAEQTPAHFMKGLAVNGFRFHTMTDRDAHRLGAMSTAEIVRRLRATTTTTNHPPGPATAMLGEIVVHGLDIRQPLGLAGTSAPAASVACLDMYKKANFPVGTKKRIAGLHLVATDVDWSHGDGPEVAGPSPSLLLAMTGRPAGLEGLSGPGVDILRARMAPAN